jgi:hypothetical protein
MKDKKAINREISGLVAIVCFLAVCFLTGIFIVLNYFPHFP